MWGGGQGGFRGAVWGSTVISALVAYTEGEASNEAEGWTLLWPVINPDGEVGFWGRLSGHWYKFRHRLQLLMEASPAAAEFTVRKIRAVWIEAEELVEDDLELGLGEGRFHVHNAVYVG